MVSFHQKHMFVALLLLLLVAVFCFAPISWALSEKKDVQEQIVVLGTARIKGGNVASAKKAALSDALAKGVQEYLARRLGTPGMENNFQRIIEKVLPQATEQVENFHILAEEKTEQSLNLLVQVKINKELMEEKLREVGLVVAEGPPIKILFLVSQIFPEQNKGDCWWMDPQGTGALTETELTLFRVFQKRGFDPINHMSYAPEGDLPPEMKTSELSHEAVINWGRAFAADVAVYGACNITQSAGVSVSLTAFDISTGGVMGEAVETQQFEDTGAGPKAVQKAMDQAIGRAADSLSPLIIKSRETAKKDINAFSLVLMGIKNFKQYREFTDFLGKDISGVKSVKQRKIKGNSLYLSVEYDGDVDGLINMIANQPKRPFPLDIMKNEEGAIVVHIRESNDRP